MPKKPNPSPQRPTSHDVARAAGVDRSTVSLVFNNVGGSRVSAATRERILKEAARLGYQPDPSARALRNGRTDEIALFAVEPLTANLTAQWILAAQERARQLGYTVVTYLFYNLSEQSRRATFASAISRHPIGIIGSPFTITRSDRDLAKRRGVQACMLTGIISVDYAPIIRWPVARAADLGARHLIERGHERIAYIMPHTPAHAEDQTTITEEREIIATAAREHGASVVELPMSLDVDSARATLDNLLMLPDRPTAILAQRDDYCFLLLRALAERHVRVPRDIAVVGIGNSPFGELSHPALTTIAYDSSTIGSHLADGIDAIVRGTKLGPEILASPPPTLVIRDSS